MSRFDIDSLSEEDLIELNHKIVARLRFLSQMRSHSAMLDFRIGERVAFRPAGRPEVIGVLTHYNKKTVTVITDSGERWNVAPGLLSKVEATPGGSTRKHDIRVVPLHNQAGGK
jgi:phosphoenolpyruvate synthase/pyruvate phosphate dikinase